MCYHSVFLPVLGKDLMPNCLFFEKYGLRNFSVIGRETSLLAENTLLRPLLLQLLAEFGM